MLSTFSWQSLYAILQNKNSDQALRTWAIDIIQEKSPVKLAIYLILNLGSGNIVFPDYQVITTTSSISILPVSK